MRWFNRYNFPYSNFHDLNLDWIIREMNRLIEEWEVLKAEWEQMKIEWAEFQAEMQRLWEDYKALMNAAWEAYKAQMNQEWADYKDEMDAAWDAYQAELNAQWLAYQNNLNAAWAAYQTSMNDWKDGVDQDIQDKFDEIDEKCRQCKADVDAAIATLNSLLASVQQQVTDYLNNLDYEPIIRDATNDWLDEHGVYIGSLTPEEFGAVGDGTTNDSQAFTKLFNAISQTGKPVEFRENAIYNISAVPALPQGSVINGNNATIYLANGSDFRVNANCVIRDLNVVGDSPATNSCAIRDDGNKDISNLYLENVSCRYLLLENTGPYQAISSNNITIKNVRVGNFARLGSSKLKLNNLSVDGLAVGGNVSVYSESAFINGVLNTSSSTTTLSSYSYGEIFIGATKDITINPSTGTTKVATYTTL